MGRKVAAFQNAKLEEPVNPLRYATFVEAESSAHRLLAGSIPGEKVRHPVCFSERLWK
jgi:hypothetical protein